MKSLGTIIRLHTLAERHQIATDWGVAPPASEEQEETLRLERTMRDPIAARTLWDHLEADERTALHAMLGPSARNWCLHEVLAERTGLDPERAEAALTQLKAHYVVDEELAKVQGSELVGQRSAFYGYVTARPQTLPVTEKPICYVPTEIATTLYTVGRELNPMYPDRTTQSLDELLMPYRQGDLDQIGRRFGLSLQVYCSRSDARVAIAENVAQAEAVHYALDQLGSPLRESYEWLVARGGRAPVAELQRRLGGSLPTTLQALRTYEEYAIAFDAFSEGERVIFIPSRTFDNLRRASARPRQEVGLQPRSAPREIRPADSTVLWDIAAFVAAVAQHEIELTRAGILPKRVAQRIMPLLAPDVFADDEETALRYLTQLQNETLELGIIQQVEAEGHTRLAFGPTLDTWASQDLRMQTHRLIRRWPQSRIWQDHVGRGFEGWYGAYIHVGKAREALLKALQQCEPGQWYDAASLLRTIQGDDPFVLRPSQRYNGQSGFKMTDEIRAHWERTDGKLLLGMLSSTLHDLGIVALGYDHGMPAMRALGDPDAISLTELGAEVLRGDLGLAQVVTEQPLVIQPNFEIVLMEPHMPALYHLVRFAQPVRIGRASRFRLTRETLLRGLGQGMTLPEVLAFLRRHSQREVAQNVAYTLSDWSRQYKDTHLSHVVLIEVENEAVAEELVTSAKLRDLGLRRVGPLAVAASEGTALRNVRRAIERAGYATHATAPATLAVGREQA